MKCKRAKESGGPCGDGYSLKIDCRYSETGCLRDCGPACHGYSPESWTGVVLPSLDPYGNGKGTRYPKGCCGQ